jgi:FlaA1/EpsC-like NDP-sugar epimerase
MKFSRNRYFFITDQMLLALAAYLSYVLRLETFDLGARWPGFFLFVGLALLITPLVFWYAGVYTRYWRYASAEELLLLSGATTTASVLIGAASLTVVQFLPRISQFPRSIPLIFLLLALAATAGPRFLVRISATSLTRKNAEGKGPNRPPQPVLIMGAGDAGAMIVREMQHNPHLGLIPVGFLDDNLGKHDVRIHGVPVLGDRNAIPAMVRKHRVRQVIIAMPTVSGQVIRDIVRICDKASVRAHTIPGMYELLGGTVTVSQLRPVQIEDLLRRAPVETDIAAVERLLQGKRVLVTGGGGSIGSELCRQIARCNPDALAILGHGENSVFEITEELSLICRPDCIHTVIADTRFSQRLRGVLETFQPEIIFHAAAHKHVPLMEKNPAEAITNNILGTRNLLEAAKAVGVDRFVMISTDKAVNPTNVMGATKRAAELLVHQAAQETGKPYGAVRFGNVLGSRGSVVLTFQRQIAAGGPVTVTDPEVKRYFMTIPEAVQLVLQAAVLGQGGEIFVLDMGEPVKISDLARDLIKLSGLEVDRDMEIAYTGLRPGEKLFEELFISGETYARTKHGKIFVVKNNLAEPASPAVDEARLERLAAAAASNDRDEIVSSLKALVPEFSPVSNDRDQIWIAPDFDAPLPEDILEKFEG